ncbi:hypothetical protein SCARR_01198 [Pontiella sulfatireligans]|uniref:Uncharacterized protein n=1 Tax=Pontiella sulfatireligans TaxID=2750658 RepID=A0A6C2UI92_9BACT|nr:hypothetical protein SCARR_01198 [Pontiella sulfatireligans]
MNLLRAEKNRLAPLTRGKIRGVPLRGASLPSLPLRPRKLARFSVALLWPRPLGAKIGPQITLMEQIENNQKDRMFRRRSTCPAGQPLGGRSGARYFKNPSARSPGSRAGA